MDSNRVAELKEKVELYLERHAEAVEAMRKVDPDPGSALLAQLNKPISDYAREVRERLNELDALIGRDYGDAIDAEINRREASMFG